MVCYNRMRLLADAVSIYDFTDNQDFHNNDIANCSDDGIELDYSEANNRVWENRFEYAGNNGISFQPYIGGPGYILKNIVIGFREGPIKDRYGSSDVYFINNTFIGHTAFTYGDRELEAAPFDMPMNAFSRNNLYLIQDGDGQPAIDLHPAEIRTRLST